MQCDFCQIIMKIIILLAKSLIPYMKKLLIAAIAVMTFGAEAIAQLEIRPLAGFNIANVSSEPDGTSASGQFGYQFGGHVLIGKRFHFYPGIAYHEQTVEFTVEQGQSAEDITIDQTIAGVDIPILVGFKFINPDDEDIFNIRAFAGPVMTFHTKTEYSEGFGDNEVDWNDFAFAGRVGLGLDIAFLFIDFSYEFGLSDVHDVSDAADNFTDMKHNTFITSAGIKIKI